MGRRSPLLVALVLVLAGCGGADETALPAQARVVELPGAASDIDFDDIVYSARLQRVLVPARDSGLYLVYPDMAVATRLPGPATYVASADAGRAALFLADRSASTITAVNPADGAVLSSAPTSAPPDYVRYIDATDELWVTEPSRAGIEIFDVADDGTHAPRPAGFIPVPDGPEGFTTSVARTTAYTHAGDDLVAIDLRSRAIIGRWATGCNGTHGFPRVDDKVGVVLASCAGDGAVSLLALDDGRRLGRYAVGGGEALPAFSEQTGHFYVRADPGTVIATLQPGQTGLALVGQVSVPEVGHCLTADRRGHYWTCDAEHGRVLRFDDPPGG
jgi:hypothetical protein